MSPADDPCMARQSKESAGRASKGNVSTSPGVMVRTEGFKRWETDWGSDSRQGVESTETEGELAMTPAGASAIIVGAAATTESDEWQRDDADQGEGLSSSKETGGVGEGLDLVLDGAR